MRVGFSAGLTAAPAGLHTSATATPPEPLVPPPPLADPDAYSQTGNHYLYFPRIERADASIHAINVVHRGLNGLVEWTAERSAFAAGEPLLRLRVSGGPDRVIAPTLEWQRVDGWLPRFRTRVGPLRVSGTICAPGGVDPLIRGGVIVLELVNDGLMEQSCEVALEGAWQWTLLSILTARPLRGENRLLHMAGPDALVLEAGEGGAGAALALCEAWYGARGALTPGGGVLASVAGADLAPLGPGEEIAAPNGAPLRFRLGRQLRIESRRRITAAFYVGVAPERDGAAATAAALRRLGPEELLHLARLDLARLGRRSRDPEFGPLLSRNLLFNYYGSVARAVDDDLIYPVLARSAAHGGTAVVGERAMLLWSLPALTLLDRALAREALIRAFEQYSARAGEQWKYLDGAVLSPGVQLDQLCAYVLALDRYIAQTEDDSVLDEPLVQDVLREIDEALYSLLDREVFLCATDLLPSGDSPDHGYTTYGNVLVWLVARALPRLWRRYPDEPPPRFFENAADEISAAIWQRCTAEVDGVPVLGYSSDLAGQVAIYDDPEGSLALLPYLGFCDADDPIWTNTMELLRSPAYPLWLHDRPFPGLATRGAPGCGRLAALCGDLLGPHADGALALLRRLRLPDGVAAEAYDPDTGEAVGGRYAPALAGFLAWTLDQALQRRASAVVTNGQRR
jgi:uncharacterized protein